MDFIEVLWQWGAPGTFSPCSDSSQIKSFGVRESGGSKRQLYCLSESQYKQGYREEEEELASLWILTSFQPHRITSKLEKKTKF